MADITVKIPAPILTAGQYFKERHRQLPGGAWSGYSTRSNLPFTISGLSEGDHQMEFILVNADATECSAVYRTFTVVGEYECITFSSQLVEDNGVYYIEVTYTLPVGYTDPPCGWEVEWQPAGGAAQTIKYNALSASGIIKIQTANTGGVLYVQAQLCNGRTKQCHVNDLVAIPDPPCTGMTGLAATIVEELQPDGTYAYFVVITFAQSTPATTQLLLDISQWGLGGLGGDSFYGTVPISATTTKVKRKLNPHMQAGQEAADYKLFVTDGCGGTHSRIDLQLVRTGPEYPQLP